MKLHAWNKKSNVSAIDIRVKPPGINSKPSDKIVTIVPGKVKTMNIIVNVITVIFIDDLFDDWALLPVVLRDFSFFLLKWNISKKFDKASKQNGTYE